MAEKRKKIYADKLIRDLKAIQDMLMAAGDPFLAGVLNRATGCVENQPEADAVEVVRCKDCKHSQAFLPESATLYCERFYLARPRKVDDFCSYGERKTK